MSYIFQPFVTRKVYRICDESWMKTCIKTMHFKMNFLLYLFCKSYPINGQYRQVVEEGKSGIQLEGNMSASGVIQ